MTGTARLRMFRRHALTPVTSLCGLAAVVALWQVTASASDPSQVPTPADVWTALIQDWHHIPALSYLEFQSGGIGAAVAFSTVHVVVGVAVGTALGLPVGVTIARARLARLLLVTPLSLLGTLPLLVMLPFITLWFGTAAFARSGLVMLFAFFTVAFATESATLTVSDSYANYAASLGASRRRILYTVILPAAAPTILGALRMSLAAGWSWEALAELLGAHDGVGRVIDVTARLGAVSDLAATVLGLAAVALLCDAAAPGASSCGGSRHDP
jgi:ABC-type nitrate/sulfonate/bicarbonate transport system permease component